MRKDLDAAVKKKMKGVLAEIAKKPGATDAREPDRYAALAANVNKIVSIPVKDIELGENVRRDVDESSEDFARLVESIKKFGVLASAVVELRESAHGVRLVCVAGHRRILAARAAGTPEKIPCLVKRFTDKGERVGAALAENMNREDLHCFDVAEGYAELVSAKWTEKELAAHFCRDPRTIRHYLKISQWPADIKALMRKHAEIFSTRVILREFAYRGFASDAELRKAVQAKITPGASQAKEPRAVRVKKRLDTYFQERSIPTEHRAAIVEALTYLKLLPRERRLTLGASRK